MAGEDAAASRQQDASDSPRGGSRLPRRGHKRRQGNLHRANVESGSRKNSQPITASPEPISTIAQEARRESDTGSRARKASSITSQESNDLLVPYTPPPPSSTAAVPSVRPSTPRIIDDEEHDDLSNIENPSPLPKSSVTPAPPELPGPEVPPQIPNPKALGSKSPRHVFRRRESKNKKGSKMSGAVGDNKDRPASPAPKEIGEKENKSTESQPEPSGSSSEVLEKETLQIPKEIPQEIPQIPEEVPQVPQENSQEIPQEESFVQVSKMPTEQINGKEPVEDAANGVSVSGQDPAEALAEEKTEKPDDDAHSEVPDDTSYAEALKSGFDSHVDVVKSQDDDDSYPELDDMSITDVHRPPVPTSNGGIRWAPWNVPLKRRSQTLAVLIHSLCMVTTVSIFFALCANPFAWPLLLIYLLHVLSSKAATDGSLRYRSEWFRKSYLWHLFAGYFPAKLHKTHELPPTRKYIFGYHPHGIISHGAWAAFGTDALGFSEKFPGITNSLLTLDSNFRIPFYREYVLASGLRSVSKESIVNILTKGGPNGEGMGRAVTVVVGGARESLEAQPGVLRLILKERKGFIKLAVRVGADLVPVLAFGENELYDQLRSQEHPLVHKIQMLILKVWKFTLPFMHGRGIFNYDVGLMPYRRPLNIVVGAPIKVQQSAIVDPEEINRLHGLYVAELEELWDRYKDEFAPNRKEEMRILP
ncbi:diacylglycerol acyltransferase-domain-containing protein [Biscogniauxia marginata]|nr:diacylglycerol acyltransferase-domain-containing protein [Biscogniauxia marginata]